jgi:hypothetical protein
VSPLSPDGNITVVTGDGTPGYSGDGGPASIAQINDAQGLVWTAPATLYGGHRNLRIRMVFLRNYHDYRGNGGDGYSGDGGPAINAQLGFLVGLAIDSSGNL